MNEEPSQGQSGTERADDFVWVDFSDPEKQNISCCYGSEASAKPGAERISTSDPRYQSIMAERAEDARAKKWRIDNLEQLHFVAQTFVTHSPNPVYRGQRSYKWKLETVLERDAKSKHFRENMEAFEFQKLLEAKRRLHHYLSVLPDDDDMLSWHALLRHHGVPTRLLDVTKSFYVACYFAVRQSTLGEDAAVWVFPRKRIKESMFFDWCRKHQRNIIRNDFRYMDFFNYDVAFPKNIAKKSMDFSYEALKIYPEYDDELNYVAVLHAALHGAIEQPGVAFAEPYWLSKRMDVQQGAFLIPFNSRMTFEDNLFPFLNVSPEQDLGSFDDETNVPETRKVVKALSCSPLIKLRIPAALHSDILLMLSNMNVRDLIIFPDLEGVMQHISEWRY